MLQMYETVLMGYEIISNIDVYLIDTFMERLQIALTRLSIDLTPLESGQHAFKSIYRNKRGGA